MGEELSPKLKDLFTKRLEKMLEEYAEGACSRCPRRRHFGLFPQPVIKALDLYESSLVCAFCRKTVDIHAGHGCPCLSFPHEGEGEEAIRRAWKFIKAYKKEKK